MSGARLVLRLERWTLAAIRTIIQARSDPESGSADMDDFSAALLSSVTTVLRAAAWYILPVHPLCTLPRAVLCNIWSHLTLIDTRAMACTSRDLACVVFCSPELWTDIYVPPGQHVLHTELLDDYLTFSVAEHLRVSLFCTADLLREQFDILANAMARITVLRLDCCDTWELYTFSHGSYAWSTLLEVLIEPAPLLTTLELRHVEGKSANDCMPAYMPLVLDHPPFSGMAPHLRRCRLENIVFPPLELCGAFMHVHLLSFKFISRVSPVVVALILKAMPCLEVLELMGTKFDPHPPVDEEISASSHPSLRILMCSFTSILRMAQLAPFVPIHQLSEFWMALGCDPYEDLSQTYRNTVGLRLGFEGFNGVVGCLGINTDDGATRQVTFRASAHLGQRLEEILSPFAHIVWLVIDEHFWYNRMARAPPVMPCLASLCVRLSPQCEYAARERRGLGYPNLSEGILVFDFEDAPWALPVLRGVCIAAPTGADLAECPIRSSCCAKPISVSLHDVARWIRYGIDFGSPGEKLDSLVLAGLCVVDLDFPAAWNELSQQVENIELAERADPQVPLSREALSYERRAVSLFQELWRAPSPF